MISGYEKMVLPDKRKENNLEVDVNFDEKPDTQNCNIIRFNLPNGKKSYIEREHLMAFLFAIGRPKEQREMIPTTIQRVRNYETMLGIKAQKDIKKGEEIKVAVKIPIPEFDQVIGQVKKEIKQEENIAPVKKSGIVLPNA